MFKAFAFRYGPSATRGLRGLRPGASWQSISRTPRAATMATFTSKHFSEEEMLQLSFITSASNGDMSRLRDIAPKINPAKGDYDRRTPLHLACAEGHEDVVKFLVEECKVDVSPLDRWNETPMADALKHGNYGIARYLKEKGAKLSQQDAELVLIGAASEGNLDLVKALLEQGVNPDAADYDHRTALHLAASGGYAEVVKQLVDAGAKVSAADRWGFTPLQDAVRNEHPDVAELLKDRGLRAKLVVSELSRLAMQRLLKTIAGAKWDYGGIWLYDDNRVLVRSDCWFAHDSEIAEIANLRSNVNEIATEDSLLHQCCVQGKPIHLESPPSSADLCLNDKQGTHGELFQSALFLPLIFHGDKVGAIAFYDRDQHHADSSEQRDALERAEALLAPYIATGSTSDTSTSIVGDQEMQVYRYIDQKGVFSPTVLNREVDWYYNRLGLDLYYFHYTPVHEIANHVLAFITAKLHGRTTGDLEKIRYVQELDDYAMYIVPESDMTEIEQRIERKYLHEGYIHDSGEHSSPFSVKFYLSKGTASPRHRQRLAIFIVQEQKYTNPDPSPETRDIWQLATGQFLRDRPLPTIKRFETVLNQAADQMTPAYFLDEKTDTHQTVLLVGYKTGSTHSFLSASSQLAQSYNLKYTKGYVENFSNGYTVCAFYLDGLIRDKLDSFIDASTVSWIFPRSYLSPLVDEGKLTLKEMAYAYSGWKFAYHFLMRSSEEFNLLYDSLEEGVARSRLNIIKKKMRMEVATEARCAETLFRYPESLKLLYADFENVFGPNGNAKPGYNKELWALVGKNVHDETDRQVLRAFCDFNAHILKTNFFKREKAALSYRLSPSFLNKADYPREPFGLFYLQGSEFRGFHVRFDDVARGGVRLIRSRNRQHYQQNAEALFDENYNLAHTQQKKNKDIPEGGSKGTILLTLDHQENGETAFQKYVDAMLDTLLPDPLVKDHYGKPEAIFLGPDEGTADVMDWAAVYAKKRGYPYWSAITTGKSPSLGGIPHDVYGMTTQSVHAYAVGIMDRLGLKEETVTKFQTGGPDGDLGSNEILMSKDRTTAIVDGSGVLYDPNGIDRTELTRLAKARKLAQHFDQTKLGAGGFFISIDEVDRTLPDGTVVESGLVFRNTFHLNPLAAADLFVPCGGRPDSININNVNQLIVGGKPRFKYIVEGANLFISQEARLRLEDAGVVVIKDASANKGGVTASSCEVLAALCLSNDEHQQHMCLRGGVVPDFYKAYVEDAQRRIQGNARDEFNCIWQESERLKLPKSIVSDMVSDRINELNDRLKVSEFWENEEFVREVLAEVIPHSLQNLIGLDTIITRLPKAYINATLSAHFASQFVYKFGLSPDEFSLYRFMDRYKSMRQ